MEIIDLSHTLKNGMPVFPGMSLPHFSAAFSLQKDGYKETEMKMLSHTGTHIDCPAHMLKSEITTDTVDLNLFYAKAFVADFRDKKSGDIISVQEIKKYTAQIEQSPAILIATNWDKYWGKQKYFDHFPYLSLEAVKFLVQKGIKTIGLDVSSIDAIDAHLYSNHYAALENNVVIVENLKNLDLLLNKEFIFSALPLKIKQGDGSPVRAVAII